MSPQAEIQLIVVLVAATCALPGAFLVLRDMSMISDSITHTVLLGIVLAFFASGDLSSPLLVAGAALTGVATAGLTEMLRKSRLVSGDASIGLVFPLLFSLAVILISRYAGAVHLDTDAVLLGELAYAPFKRLVIAGVDIGAESVYASLLLLAGNAVFIGLFFKELKLASFDPVQAAVLGFSPAVLHYCLMTLVSVTAVGAFEAAGSVLVVALMIAPPATAHLLTDRLEAMLPLSVGLGALSGLAGCRLAFLFDVSISGCVASCCGAVFFVVLILAPGRGVAGRLLRRRRKQRELLKQALMLHLRGDRDGPVEPRALFRALGLGPRKAGGILRELRREGLVRTENGVVRLTRRAEQGEGPGQIR